MSNAIEHPLAHKGGIEMMFALLLYQGAMCPKCGMGTRVKNKRFSKCIKCGNVVERKPLPPTKPKPTP